MKNVKITDNMNLLAKKLAEMAEGASDYDINYTGIDEPDRWYKGYKGEIAFFKLLKDSGKRAIMYLPISDKHYKGKVNIEFWIYTEGEKKEVDVKTADDKEHYRRILISEIQDSKNPTALYVGAKLNGDSCDIYGYANLQEMDYEKNGFTDAKKPTYWKFLEDLDGIENLIPTLDDGVAKILNHEGELVYASDEI